MSRAYTFHQGVPHPAPARHVAPVSDTPIYTQLVLERAMEDEEGRGLVSAIHARHAERLEREAAGQLAKAKEAIRPAAVVRATLLSLVRG